MIVKIIKVDTENTHRDKCNNILYADVYFYLLVEKLTVTRISMHNFDD
jgi:hypothetical protein